MWNLKQKVIECKKRTKFKSVCDFIGLENNKLHHKFDICKKDG